jgi:hypothetical protein
VSGDGGFLSRWSRRKRAAEAEQTPPEAEAEEPPRDAQVAPITGEATPPPACPIPDLPEIDPATLPPVEELTASSDLGPFLRPGVPAALRSAALRRMWSVDPAIRDFIGCVDYQWDFNTPGGLPAGFASELGGDVAKLLAQAIGRIGDDERQEVEEPPEQPPPPPPSLAPTPDAAPPLPDSPLRLEAAPEPMTAAAEAVEEPAPAPRRRHGSALPS